MKIVATMGEGKVLVEMTHREIANVVGKRTEDGLEVHRRCASYHLTGLEVGTEYQVSPAWQRLEQQETVASQLEGVSRTLAALSDLVTQTKVQFTSATADAPKTEGGAR